MKEERDLAQEYTDRKILSMKMFYIYCWALFPVKGVGPYIPVVVEFPCSSRGPSVLVLSAIAVKYFCAEYGWS